MSDSDEKQSLKNEIEAVFKKYGMSPPEDMNSTLSTEDYRKIRRIADQIVRGDINMEEISGLSKSLRAQLDSMIKHIIGLKGKSSLRAIQESNPFYDVFSSKIVRDS